VRQRARMTSVTLRYRRPPDRRARSWRTSGRWPRPHRTRRRWTRRVVAEMPLDTMTKRRPCGAVCAGTMMPSPLVCHYTCAGRQQTHHDCKQGYESDPGRWLSFADHGHTHQSCRGTCPIEPVSCAGALLLADCPANVVPFARSIRRGARSDRARSIQASLSRTLRSRSGASRPTRGRSDSRPRPSPAILVVVRRLRRLEEPLARPHCIVGKPVGFRQSVSCVA